MFSLSTFQSKGHSESFSILRNIQKDVTLNTNLDTRFQKSCFRKGRLGISRLFNTNRIFATFGQSGHKVRCKRQNSIFLGKKQSASNKKPSNDSLKRE